MSNEISGERAAFEAWWASKYAEILTPDGDDDDANSACRIARIAASDAWQAALAHKSEVATPGISDADRLAWARGYGYLTWSDEQIDRELARDRALGVAPAAQPQAAPSAGLSDARYAYARQHAYSLGVNNPTPEEFDGWIDSALAAAQRAGGAT